MSSGIENISNRKWFYPIIYALVFLISSFTPHYTSTGYSYFEESGKVLVSVMFVGLDAYRPLTPFFHIATIALLIAIWRFGNRVRRIFSLYVGANLIFIALAQCVGTTKEYGFVIMTGTVISFILIGLLWIWETLKPKNDLSFKRLPLVRYWPIPLAFFAFWSPIRLSDLQPDFSPVLLLTSWYGIGGCATLPVFICLLTLFYPRVNEPVYKITSFVGVIYGFWNMFSLLNPYTRWLGVLHFPLLFISIYALVLPNLIKRKPFSRNFSGEKVKE